MSHFTDSISLDLGSDMLRLLLETGFSLPTYKDTITVQVKAAGESYTNINIPNASGHIINVFELEKIIGSSATFKLIGKGRCLKHKVFNLDGTVLVDLRIKPEKYILFEEKLAHNVLVFQIEVT